MRIAILMLTLVVAACGVAPTGPAGQPSTSNVNPITGTRGGSGSSTSK
jgi:hypothetical protein